MNTLTRYTVAILFCLTGSLLLLDNASAAKPKKVIVSSVAPDSASQGDTVSHVVIRGSGFDNGSAVRFLVAGTNDDAQVEITGVIDLVDGDLVVPTLHVLDAATVDLYDVEVRTSSGRRGKGTDLFRVEQKGGGGGNEKDFQARVTFDDLEGDTITSDDGRPYIEGTDAHALVPVEFSPPGQFVMTLRLQGNRFLFFNFGAAVDCIGADSGTLECVADKYSTKVPCPFPPGERGVVDDSQCSGYKRVVMGFRHAFVDGSEVFMLGMPNGATFDGEGDNIEIDFREESRKDDDLRLRFDANCLGLNEGDFLKITAWDNVGGDGIPNDEWKIDTGTGTKTACLTKKGNGHRENLIGLFDMQFGYTICILTGTGEGNEDCPQH